MKAKIKSKKSKQLTSSKDSKTIFWFKDLSKQDVAIAGGKGASLGEMTRAGIPVPNGFVISSSTFDKFIDETEIFTDIDAVLHKVNHKDVSSVENASEEIKAMIMAEDIPKYIKKEILNSFKKLGAKFVAVRSSATSEDSSTAAWAGQLDSYLNTTEKELIENVKKCWASLFTPRAIFYRFEKNLHKHKISVAVVVQKMIESEVSGVAFSVHPVTQDYDQLIIEGAYGLGEAIVSGQITPDSYVVEKKSWEIIEKAINSQEKGIFRAKQGNEWKEIKEDKENQKLTDKQIVELAKLIVKIESHYGFPVDVEWAKEKGKFYIVQSRPITTLIKEETKESTLQIEGFEWQLTITRNMSFWHQCLSDEGHFWHSIDFGVDNKLETLFLIENGTEASIFRHQPNYEEYAQSVLNAVNAEQKIILMKSKYKEFAENALTSLKKCLKTLNADALKNFLHNYRILAAGLMLTATLGRYGGELLAKKLKEAGYAETEIPEIMAAITYPHEHTPLFKSQIDLLEIGAEIQAKKLKGKKISSTLNEWLSRHSHIPVNFCGDPWTIKDAEEQLKSILKKDCKKELAKLNKSHDAMINGGKELLEKINKKEITILSHALAEGTYLNEFRKNIFSKLSLEFRPIFKKVAEKAGSKDWRDCFYLTPNEMLNIVSGEKLSLAKIKKERKSVVTYIGKEGIIRFLDAEKTKKLADYVHSLYGKEKEEAKAEEIVKGTIANTGKVKGIVKVVLKPEEFYKINPGDILVTTMTSVDFVPIMEKAAAFVTNEGGITSHASIVSREMNKPCIINTKNATQILKDGDHVEVDADKGIVKKLK